MATIPLQTTVHGSGPGIVLAHGAGGSIDSNFGGILPLLAADHTVVASDYPADDTPLDLDALADALVAAAVDAGVQTFTIIGFSLGTAVAVRAAARHPERVTGLVLTAGLAAPDNRAKLAVQAWQDLLARGAYESFARLVLLTGFSAEFVNALPTTVLDEMVAQTAAAIPGGTRQQAALVETVDTTADLAGVAVPTLIVNTTADLLVAPANSRVLSAAIPGAEYVELDAGHVVMLEQPAPWATHLTDFLTKHNL
ncbi:alpha/beta hydrolase [Nocardia neocaledoniensis NBRC 108232]|uniref:Pimeloyl-ACP methyl ester carboxylesterase n=1 Tax=Nocardia neocaledoniensis TaxID=236511 RepID=A0A317NW72_9NOCA|nr:alpha/beta hydrolase [Nocardia neocaledoniensis]PWV79153.1 pimeloyl-ACP methyl ester carboxylesterase [Nocardia neocaledoniensis]GEM33214.1 alpha/beta hydrolase [Nocardia neocaledoniensis NBRC 108232]